MILALTAVASHWVYRHEMAALALWVLLLAGGCARHGGPPPAAAVGGLGLQFTDVTATAGLHFRHTSGASGRLYLPETLGSGCAILDYNGDGRPDLFLVNGSRLPGYPERGPFYSALYQNLGPGPDGFPHFADVTRSAGLEVDCYGMGVAIGDYDNDGRPDLFLTALGASHLFHNNGDGSFSDVTRQSGVSDSRWGTTAAWVDYDRDRRLDLLVGHYCQWTPATNQICRDAMNVKRMCRPAAYRGQDPVLYHNRGDGTFVDVTAAAGLGGDAGKTLGIAVWDEDGDGWPDLLLANDGERNRFYRNRPGTAPGTRRFEERGLETGLAYGMTGHARAGMGVDTADIDNSGAEAVAIGNFAREGTALYVRDAPGHYSDLAGEMNVLAPSLASVTFGVLFCDVDLDGYRDLVTTNGHIEPSDETDTGIPFAQRPLLFQNAPAPAAGNPGRRSFREVGSQAGPGFQTRRVGRGLAAADLDGDGDPDLLINANGGPAALLRNDLAVRRRWLAILPVGTRCNRDAFGARLVVTAGDMRQQAWRRSGSSFCSQSDGPLLFGLGDHERAQKVEVIWPDGSRQTMGDVKADQLLTIRQSS